MRTIKADTLEGQRLTYVLYTSEPALSREDIEMDRYRVTFETRTIRRHHWAIDLLADNLPDARERARKLWSVDSVYKHFRQYELDARRLLPDEATVYGGFIQLDPCYSDHGGNGSRRAKRRGLGYHD